MRPRKVYINNIKRCNRCKEDKDLSFFSQRNKIDSNGDCYMQPFSMCKECASINVKEWLNKNPGKKEIYRIKFNSKEYRKKGNDKRREYRKEYYKKYNKINKDKVVNYQKKYHKKYSNEMPDSFIINRIRNSENINIDKLKSMPEIIELKRLQIKLKRKVYESEQRIKG
jgi:hypothetical protein